MERCSMSPIIREMQIKTAIWYHLLLVRMAIIKKTTKDKCWWGYGKKGTLAHSWWECKLVQPLWKTVWRFLRKLKLELPYDPANPLSSIYLKKNKNTNSKRYTHPRVYCNIIYTSQGMEATQIPIINRWMDKEDVVYVYVCVCDEMAGWHHWLDGRESKWTPGVGDGQGGLACCDSWGRKESDTTERLIWSDLICVYNGILPSHKQVNFHGWTWRILCLINKAVREIQILYHIT